MMLVKQQSLNEVTIPSTTPLRKTGQNSLLLEAIKHDVIFEDVMLGNEPSESPNLDSNEENSQILVYKKLLELPQDVSAVNSLNITQEDYQLTDEVVNNDIDDQLELPIIENEAFVNQLDEVDIQHGTQKIVTDNENSNRSEDVCEKSIQSTSKENNSKDLVPVVIQSNTRVETFGKNPINLVPYSSSESESVPDPSDYQLGISEARSSAEELDENKVKQLKIKRRINQRIRFSSSESESEQDPNYQAASSEASSSSSSTEELNDNQVNQLKDKRKINQRKKYGGKEYLNCKNVIQSGKKIRDNPCIGKKCNNSCNTFSENERKQIFYNYYNLEDNKKQKVF